MALAIDLNEVLMNFVDLASRNIAVAGQNSMRTISPLTNTFVIFSKLLKSDSSCRAESVLI